MACFPTAKTHSDLGLGASICRGEEGMLRWRRPRLRRRASLFARGGEKLPFFTPLSPQGGRRYRRRHASVALGFSQRNR